MWQFIQDEVLGMKWLNRLIGSLLSSFGLDIESRIGGSVQFFLYDCIKIMVLLGVLIFIISYIQSYFPPERSRKILGRFHGIWAQEQKIIVQRMADAMGVNYSPLITRLKELDLFDKRPIEEYLSTFRSGGELA